MEPDEPDTPPLAPPSDRAPEPAAGSDPEPGRGRTLVAAVAVTAVLALVAGLLVVVTGGDDGDGELPEADSIATTTTAPPDEPATEAEIDAAVAELTDFVADARQLEFQRPVEVTLLATGDFEARIREDAVADDPEELDEAARVFRAVGLLREDVDLEEALTSFLAEVVDARR